MGSALLVAGLLLLLGPASLGDGGGAAPERHQYCVVGAGPAGLQLGFFLQQAQRDYVILERASGPGAFFRKYPVHRQLISINKRYTGHELDEPRRSAEFNLRHDWNSLVNDQAVGGKSLLFTNYSERYLPPAESHAGPRFGPGKPSRPRWHPRWVECKNAAAHVQRLAREHPARSVKR